MSEILGEIYESERAAVQRLDSVLQSQRTDSASHLATLAFVPQAQLQLLPNLSHVPISDNPALIARLIVDFAATESPLAA